jgi:adenosylcobinamide-GDP ribazoletransferase
MGIEETGDDGQRKPAKPSSANLFLTAVQFLLISPAFIRRSFTPQELGGAVGFYPLVGALLGLILLALDAVLSIVLPALVRSALILALWVLLTGALHLDGFLDTCDGLLGGYTPERRLEIMRDERVGAYALAGGMLLMLTKFSALGALGPDRSAALLLAPVLGRWGMAIALASFPYARAQGLGRDVKDHVTRRQVLLATFFTILWVILATWLAQSWVALLAFAMAGLVVWGGARFTLRRIPGLTGDIYGALNELVEAVTLLVFVMGLYFGR